MHGPPGDDVFLSPPKTTHFFPRTRENRDFGGKAEIGCSPEMFGFQAREYVYLIFISWGSHPDGTIATIHSLGTENGSTGRAGLTIILRSICFVFISLNKNVFSAAATITTVACETRLTENLVLKLCQKNRLYGNL